MTSLLTLYETVQAITNVYDDSRIYLACDIARLLGSRWSFLRSKYIAETGTSNDLLRKVSLGADGVEKEHMALPEDFAKKHVSTWIPWALNEIKKEIDLLDKYFYHRSS